MSQSKLRGIIREKFGTQGAFAEAMCENGCNLSECSVSKKLNGHTEWTADEIRTGSFILGIKPEDIPIYFPVSFF